jgi:streptomycin 6-kinase
VIDPKRLRSERDFDYANLFNGGFGVQTAFAMDSGIDFDMIELAVVKLAKWP